MILIPSSLSPQKSRSSWASLVPSQWHWEKPEHPKSLGTKILTHHLWGQQQEKPLQKAPQWLVWSQSVTVPCWNIHVFPFFPWPCLRSDLEVLEWAEQGPWSCLGSCSAPAPMPGWELLSGTGLCAVPQPSWPLGFAWEVQDLKESVQRLRWERFLFTPKFWRGFLPHECTVGSVLSLVFGDVEVFCCACWFPALFFRGALGMILSFGACCFAA